MKSALANHDSPSGAAQPQSRLPSVYADGTLAWWDPQSTYARTFRPPRILRGRPFPPVVVYGPSLPPLGWKRPVEKVHYPVHYPNPAAIYKWRAPPKPPEDPPLVCGGETIETFEKVTEQIIYVRGRPISMADVVRQELRLSQKEESDFRTHQTWQSIRAKTAKVRWKMDKKKLPHLPVADDFVLPPLEPVPVAPNKKTHYHSGWLSKCHTSRDVTMKLQRRLAKYELIYEFGLHYDMRSISEVMELARRYQEYLRGVRHWSGPDPHRFNRYQTQTRAMMKWYHGSSVRRYITHFFALCGVVEFRAVYKMARHEDYLTDFLSIPDLDAPLEVVEKQMEDSSASTSDHPFTRWEQSHTPTVPAAEDPLSAFVADHPVEATYRVDRDPVKGTGWVRLPSATTSNTYVPPRHTPLPVPLSDEWEELPHRLSTQNRRLLVKVGTGVALGVAGLATAAVTGPLVALGAMAAGSVVLPSLVSSVTDSSEKATYLRERLRDAFSLRGLYDYVKERVLSSLGEYFNVTAISRVLLVALVSFLSLYFMFRIIRACMPQIALDTLCGFSQTLFPFVNPQFFTSLFAATACVKPSEVLTEEEEEEIEQQADDQLSTQSVVDFLASILGSSKPAIKRSFFTAVEYLPKFHRLSQAVEYFFKKAREFLSWAVSSWLDIPIPVTTLEGNVLRFADETVELQELSVRAGGYGSLFRSAPDVLFRVRDLTERAASLTVALTTHGPVHAVILNRFQQAVTRLNKQRDEVQLFLAAGERRPLPVWFALSGEPGVKKSYITHHLMKAVHERMHLRGHPGYERDFSMQDVYQPPQSETYHDGYNGQHFLFLDDLFQIKDLQERAKLCGILMLYMGSGACPLLVADMNAKGAKWLTSPFFFTTSNEPVEKDVGIAHIEALQHRQTLPLKVHKHVCRGTGRCVDQCPFFEDLEFHLLERITAVEKDPSLHLKIDGKEKTVLTAPEVVALGVAIYEHNIAFNAKYDQKMPQVDLQRIEYSAPRFQLDLKPRPVVVDPVTELAGTYARPKEAPPSDETILKNISSRLGVVYDRICKRADELASDVAEVIPTIRERADLLKQSFKAPPPPTVEEVEQAAAGIEKQMFSWFQKQKAKTDDQINWLRQAASARRTHSASLAAAKASSITEEFQAQGVPLEYACHWRLHPNYIDLLTDDQFQKLHDKFIPIAQGALVDSAFVRALVEACTRRMESLVKVYVVSPLWEGFKSAWTTRKLRSYREISANTDGPTFERLAAEANSNGSTLADCALRLKAGQLLGTFAVFGASAAILGLLAAALVAVFRHAFGYNEEKQSGRFAGAKAKPRIVLRGGKPVRAPQRLTTVQKQAGEISGIERVLLRNLYNIAAGSRKCYTLAIGGHMFLLNKHFLDGLPDDTQIILGADGLASMTAFPFSDCTVVTPASSSNYVFLRIPGHRLMRKIPHFFHDTQTMSGPRIRRLHPVWEVQNERATVFTNLEHSDTWERLASDLEDCDFKIYNMSNKLGMCGLPYYITNVLTGDHIVGIHGAGSPGSNLSFGASVSRHEVLEALRIDEELSGGPIPDVAPRQDIEELVKQSADFPLGVPMPFTPGTHHIGMITKNFRLQTETKLAKTTLHPERELTDSQGLISMHHVPTRIPARLKPENGISPLNTVQRKYGEIKGQPNISYNIPSEVLEAYPFDSFVPTDFSPKRATTILTVEQAVLGSDGVASLDLTKSPGFPFTTQGLRRKDVLFSSPGVLNPDFVKEVHDLQERLKTTVVPMVVQDALKDELLPIEDVEAGKSRRFCIGELSYLVLGTMYFYYFFEELEKHPAETPCSVGLNVHDHSEWGVLHDRLSKHPNLMAGDYSGYEYTLLAQGPDLWNEMCDRVAPLPPPHDAIRRNLCLSSLQCYHVLMSRAYLTSKGNSSGNFLTSPYGSLMNDVLHFFAFVAAGYKPADYRKYVERAFYSDDSLVSVSHHCPDFNMITMQETMSSIGIVYTASNKGPVTLPYLTLSEVEYLKRRFVFRNGTCFAPLAMASILEAPMWVSRTSDDPVGDTIAALRSVLVELLHYPPSLYNEYRQIAMRWSHAIGRPTTFATFNQARHELPGLFID